MTDRSKPVAPLYGNEGVSQTSAPHNHLKVENNADSKNLNLILTMAGKYARFRLFGSKVPKYLLPLGSHTILSEIVKRFRSSAPSARILLIANRSDQIFFPIVRSIMSMHSLPSEDLIYIDDTSSQLETALYASELLSTSDHNMPCAFANIDTILYNRTHFFTELMGMDPRAGRLDTFPGENNQYSYARIDNFNRVLDVVDKNIISNMACSGLYGFGSYAFMSHIANGVLRKSGKAGFTDLYIEYINLGLPLIASHEVCRDYTIVLGTPEEYVINIHRF
jgi:hypothetical protein